MKRSKMIGKKTNFIKFMIIFFPFDLIGDFHKTLLGGIFYLNFYYELFHLLIKHAVLINILTNFNF